MIELSTNFNEDLLLTLGEGLKKVSVESRPRVIFEDVRVIFEDVRAFISKTREA